MAEKGTRYKRQVYFTDYKLVTKFRTLLEDLDVLIKSDLDGCGYYVAHFKASRDEFETIKRGLNLRYRPVYIGTVCGHHYVTNKWCYEIEES